MTYDYTDFKEEPPIADGPFKELNRLVNAARDLRRRIEGLNAETTRAESDLRDILQRDIPNLCRDMGLKEFTTADGTKVNIREQVDAHIKADNRGEAHQWLNANGHGGLIKREVSVSFTREQADAAARLLTDLRKQYQGVSEKQAVHPSTLKAWAREMLATGQSFPLELFGVYRRDEADIG